MHGMTPAEITLVSPLGSGGFHRRGGRHWEFGYSDRVPYMQTSTVINFRPLATGTRTDASDCSDAFGPMPELPKPTQRWTVRRKAAVIESVPGGWVPIDAIRELYSVSVDEFLAWERDIDRYGIHGLRTTPYQIYR